MMQTPDTLNQKNILIVDDTADNLRFLDKILTEQGYYVRKALNGKTALNSCQNSPPDLILLDIRMPDIDGYEVCQQLKANEETKLIPVIFLSALNDAFDKVKAFKVGGVDYITKPFQLEEVIVRVQNQLIIKAAEGKIIQLNTELEQKVLERTQQLEQANQELKREIVERQHLQSQLLHMAFHDPLTNLPNRALFMQRLEAALKRMQGQTNEFFALLFLDCDRFKVINDSLGHLVGDELLIAIARRLEVLMKDSSILARLGGDEFAIILENISQMSDVAEAAEQVLTQFSKPFQLTKHEVFSRASIGIVFGKSDYEKAENLLRDADIAMYRAKALGRNRYYIFDSDLQNQTIRNLTLENDLPKAIKQQEFLVYYQPIVALNQGTISGFEALIRWCHPVLGMVPPSEFIPVAEEAGLIAEIDTWVLKQACRQLQIWQRSDVSYQDLTMSVNLSTRLFSEPNLVEQVEGIIQKYQIIPASLKLEITESVLMEDMQLARRILEKFQHQGLQVCIDDFGTGHSSLSYLEELPVNTLKIDRCFIQRMRETSQKKGLVSTIINIANSMEMSAIAEGIETSEQLAQLRSIHCDFGQGYLFSKPVNSELATNLLKSRLRW